MRWLRRSIPCSVKAPGSVILRAMKRLALSVLILVLLAGCSGPKFLYNRADWFINWYLDDYIDFNRDQQRVFDEVLDDHLQWHRRHELPRLEDEVVAVRETLAAELTGRQVHELSERSIELWRDSMRPALPEMADILRSLSDEQIDDFLRSLAKANRDFAEEYVDVSGEELEQLRAERIHEMGDFWLDGLTPAQKRRVAQWAQSAPNVYPAMLRQRQLWREQLGEALAQRAAPDFEERLRTLLLYPRSLWSEEYSERMRVNRAAMKRLMVDMHANLNKKQRAHLLAKIDELLEDIRALQRGGESG